MRLALQALTTTMLAAGIASTACAPSVADGAARIYSVAEICPHDGVTVKGRSDLAPHSVLKGVSTAPGVNIDSITDTYELTGCGKKVLYVCGRPVIGNHPDPFSVAVWTPDDVGPRLAVNTPYFTETRAIDIDGDRIENMTTCQPINEPGQQPAPPPTPTATTAPTEPTPSAAPPAATTLTIPKGPPKKAP